MPESLLSRENLAVALAILISLVRYATYFQAIYRKEARPHVFTWFNWGLTCGVGAYAQMALGGGASAWILVFVSASCLFIAGLALFVGERNITRSDWGAFIGGLLALALLQVQENPLYGAVALVVNDSLGYYPTVRKSWNDPWGEPPVSYLWAGSRYFIAMFAVPEFTWRAEIYLFFLMATDWMFAAYLWWRRAVLARARAIG